MDEIIRKSAFKKQNQWEIRKGSLFKNVRPKEGIQSVLVKENETHDFGSYRRLNRS